MMVSTCRASTWETWAGELQVWDQLGAHRLCLRKVGGRVPSDRENYLWWEKYRRSLRRKTCGMLEGKKLWGQWEDFTTNTIQSWDKNWVLKVVGSWLFIACWARLLWLAHRFFLCCPGFPWTRALPRPLECWDYRSHLTTPPVRSVLYVHSALYRSIMARKSREEHYWFLLTFPPLCVYSVVTGTDLWHSS